MEVLALCWCSTLIAVQVQSNALLTLSLCDGIYQILDGLLRKMNVIFHFYLTEK